MGRKNKLTPYGTKITKTMSTPRKIRIKKIADFGAGTSGMDHNYGFIFSDDLTDWQQSKRLKANEYVKKKYWESKRATV